MKFTSIVLLITLLQTQVCNPEEFFPENSVLFNQIMIPVWTSLKLQDYETARDYSREIHYNFDQLLGDAYIYQETWVEFVHADLNLLEYSLENGENEDAMELAYCVMDELHDWHALNDRDYYFDKIWDFELSYRHLKEVLNDYNLKLYEWNDLENLIEEFNNCWEILLTKPIDRRGYYFIDSPEMVDFLASRDAINLCIQEFNAQIEEADRGYLAETCNEIELNLVNLITVFGNYHLSEETASVD